MSVGWTSLALDRLADIYVLAVPADRGPIAACVEGINRRLADDPSGPGESRTGSRRVWFTGPLVVGFDLLIGGGVIVFHVERLKHGAVGEGDL
jgi:hypothetical protein